MSVFVCFLSACCVSVECVLSAVERLLCVCVCVCVCLCVCVCDNVLGALCVFVLVIGCVLNVLKIRFELVVSACSILVQCLFNACDCVMFVVCV